MASEKKKSSPAATAAARPRRFLPSLALLPLLAFASVVAVSGTGCDGDDDDDAPPPPPPTLERWKPPAATAAEIKDGPVYLGIKSVGIGVIDGKGSRLAARVEEDIYGMAVDAKGKLVFSTVKGVFELRDDGPRLFADKNDMGLASIEAARSLVFDGKQRLWVLGSRGTVTVRTGGDDWSEVLKEKSGMKFGLGAPEAIVDADGAIWIAADDSLYKQVGDKNEFAAVDVTTIAREDYMRNFKRIALAGDGSVLTPLSSGLFVNAAGTWKQMDLAEGHNNADFVAAGPGVVVAAVGNTVHRVSPDDVSVTKPSDDTYKASDVFDLELDTRGRAWMATNNGLVSIDPAGKATHWPPATLAGIYGRIETIIPVAGGPAKLPGITKAVKGKVLVGIARGGKPLEGVLVQMCESPKQIFKKTPCESAVWVWNVTTGANGKVQFNDVAVGNYNMTFKIGDKWHMYRNPMHPFECCTELKEGQLLDVGVFEAD